MALNPLAWAALCAAVAGLFGGVWFAGYRSASSDCQERMAEMERAALVERVEQARRMDKLQVEIEVMRGKPERVREVVREVRVHADVVCESLPSDWRRLWNAGSSRGDAPAASGVGDAAVSGVADDAGRGEGAN